MPRFKVNVTKEFMLSYQVDAEDAEEAEQIVNDALNGDGDAAAQLEEDFENGQHFELWFEEPRQLEEVEEE